MKAQADDFPAEPPDPVQLAVPLIARFESFSATAYPDPPGQTNTYSIGYGHQIVPGDDLDTASIISKSDALTLLQTEVSGIAKEVGDAVTVELSAEQLAALYSFTYNEGIGHFRSSTLLKCINAGDFSGAKEQFAVWNKAGGKVSRGLANRRQEEAGLFGSVPGPAASGETADA